VRFATRPQGHLSGGVEAGRPGKPQAVTDRDTVVITPYRDGPLLVRGPVTLRDPAGREIANDRNTIALCRCGKSRIKPFCDGTHKLTGFRAPAGPATTTGPPSSM
jgi:CDGSH-type Zn-finger protein